ncbi:MAG: hypothetical protein ABI905_09110 [Betaproteobacteria bacterium]
MRTSLFRAIGLLALVATTLFPLISAGQNLTSVVSRKLHATAGPYEILVDTGQPIGGNVTVDPRAIGSGHLVVFIFDAPAVAPASVDVVDSQSMPVGSSSVSTVGQEVLVTVTGIANNSRIQVSLKDGSATVYASASMGFLVGDVDNSRVINSTDVNAVKSRSGFPASLTNFQFDVGTTGTINVSDIAAVKSRLGQSLAPAGQAALAINLAGAGGGSVTSTPAGIACPGICASNFVFNTSVTLNATPNVNSTFSGWSGACSAGTATLAASVACTATFAAITYAVTPSAGANGAISPASVQSVNKGTATTFTVTPSVGFAANVTGTCGGSLAGTVYTTNVINGPCTVIANFVAANFTVTPSAGANGAISPSTPQSVPQGSTKAFTISPNANYTPSVGGTCGGTLSGPTYTTNVITASCTVSATFVRNSYTVTPSAGLNGTISPSTAQTVLNGNTKTFTVTPSAGFTALVGGTCGGTLTGTSLVTNAITGNCSVIVSFASSTPKYVSTTGNDTTGNGSIGSPWKTIGKGISTLVSGETLIIKAGVYSGTQNFITGVPSGIASKYTTVMAETPMQTRIQSLTTLGVGENQLNLSANYIKVDGFIFDMQGTTNPAFTGTVSGNFNTVSRSIFKRSGDIDSFGGLLEVTGNDNLFEDMAGTGACAICFKQGGASAITQRNIWRRVVGRFDYSNSTQPKATFGTIGGSTPGNVRDHLYQNVIAIDGQNPGNLGGAEKMGGFYAAQNTANITLQGSIVLNEGAGPAGMLLRELGSVNNTSHSVVWDIQNPGAGAIGLIGGNGDHLTIGGNVPGPAVDLITSATASLLKPGANPANLLNNTPGAVITKQYGVSGTRWGQAGYDQITSVDLWPWPYQDTIKTVFQEANNVPAGNSPATNSTFRGFASTSPTLFGGANTLTSYVWEYLGTPCPPTVCVTYTVTPSSGANGTISPTTPQTVVPNTMLTFTLTPSSGFTASVGGTCGGTITGSTYTTNPVTGNCTVIASFSSAPTWYISPTGNNAANGQTPATAWKTFAKAFGAMAAGDELILLDGQYSPATTGVIHWDTSQYGVNSAQAKSGVSLSRMTVVRAQNPGKVTVNGGLFIGRSTRKDSFILIKGITFEGTGDLYNTSFNTIKDCGFHGTFGIGTADHQNGNTDNLIEDVWVWAAGERIIAINYQADRNVWRRLVVRGDGCGTSDCSGSGNPNVGFTVYDSRDASMQNVMVIDRILSPSDEPYGSFATAQHTPSAARYLGRNEWLGSMAISVPDAGFHFEADDTIPVDPTWTVKDVIVTGTVDFDGINVAANGRLILSNATIISPAQQGDGIRVGPGSVGTSVTNTIVKGFNRGLNSSLTPSFTDTFGSASLYNQTTPTVGVRTTNPTADGATPSLKYPTRIEAGSALKGTGSGGADYGANIVNRIGADGTRFGDAGYNTGTAVALWPWPNQARIKQEMCAVTTRGFCATGLRLDGSKQVSLTSYVWEQLGNAVPVAIDP